MDLKQHLLRQMAFSHATFGPGERTAGVLDHIGKEVEEVRAANGAAAEWVDIVILALDGLTRQLAFCTGTRLDPQLVAELACNMIQGKQSRNEGRDWPDWRTAPLDKAIEHSKAPRGRPADVPSVYVLFRDGVYYACSVDHTTLAQMLVENDDFCADGDGRLPRVRIATYTFSGELASVEREGA